MEPPDRDGSIQPTNPIGKTRGALCLLAAYLFFLLALSIDLVFWTGKPLLAEGIPEFSDLHLYRTGLIAFSAAGVVLALSPWGLGRGEYEVVSTGREREIGRKPARAGQYPEEIFPPVRPELIHWGILGLAIVSLLLFLVAPDTFLELQNEDRPVETWSALFLFAACLVMLRVFWAYRKTTVHKAGLYAGTALLLSAVLFLIGMEEVSWFQRVLSLETPDILEVNPRDELNLHNLATDLVENIYYGGAFVFLVLLPYLDRRTGLLRKKHFIQAFIPSGSVLLAASLAMAYNYDMWNILFTQLAFFLTLIILVDLAWGGRRDKTSFLYLAVLALTLVLAQSFFLALGDRFIQGWEVTEYKELLIPLAFLIYGREIYRRAHATSPASHLPRVDPPHSFFSSS